MTKILRKATRWLRSDNLKSKIKNLKSVGFVTLVLALTMCGAVAAAQQPARIHRIGILSPASASIVSARVEAFRQRLRELGYVEGKNIVIEYRYAEGKHERVPDLAAELVRLKVDVIVTTGVQPVLAAKKASATIPIVFAAASDPVGAGLVSSLARPGGNITGLSLMAPDLDGKRLELLKEAFPKVARVAFLWQSGGTRETGNSQIWRLRPRRWESNFYRFRCEALTILRAHSHERKRTAPRRSLRTQVDLSVLSNAKCWTSRPRTDCRRSIHTSEFVEAGGLMSYASSNADLYRRAADFVDKILKGTKPADIPVEQPTKFEFLVNLKTAKQIGVTIPSSVLARAERVIK